MALSSVAVVVPQRPCPVRARRGHTRSSASTAPTTASRPDRLPASAPSARASRSRMPNGLTMTTSHGLADADDADLVVAPAFDLRPCRPRRRSSTSSAGRTRGAPGCSRCAPARSCSARPGCSTAAPAPRTGGTPRAGAAVPRGDGRPRRALRRGRPGDHQRRHRRRDRRLPAPRALRARRLGGQHDRPADGGAAAARRRPAPVHRPAGAGLHRRQPVPAADLDARAPRRGPARAGARQAGGDVGAHLRPPLRRRDRHHARASGCSPSGCTTPAPCWRAPTSPSRRSPPAPASARPPCCATTSAPTWAWRRRSTGVRSAPRTSARADRRASLGSPP